jgi:hypothetical protein
MPGLAVPFKVGSSSPSGHLFVYVTDRTDYSNEMHQVNQTDQQTNDHDDYSHGIGK